MIPVHEPRLKGNEKKYLNECISSGWISSEGPFVKKFEDSFASFTGVKHGVAVCNGTAALEAALFGLGVKPGNEVIMPAFTIISCALAALRLGAKPVLVDIEPRTWTMDVSQVEAKITSKTRVIMPVHIYGHPVNMDEIFRLAQKYNLKILEDAAEAHGAQYYSKLKRKWLKCGAMGDSAATSFYANKVITTGEGGMVLTGNREYAEKARYYRNLCFKEGNRFYHTELGYNFRMTNLQAAIGLAQLEQIENFIQKKARLADWYRKSLSQIKGIRFMEVAPYARSIFWVYAVELDKKLGLDASEVMAKLARQGIGTRPFFKGLHTQPALKSLGLFRKEKYPCSEFASRYGFYLPGAPSLSRLKVKKIAGALKNALEKK